VQLDVFTLLPHALAWLTEQRPVATVLGTELDLRLFSYRDTTPLRAAQVDDQPYGGGAGMVLRVDVGSEESGLVESFSAELDGGLEYPHYTRPSEFRGWRVPDVLLSGDHRRIDEWRKEQSRLRSSAP
jgi:tRNA G37 N-methylase TrmD